MNSAGDADEGESFLLLLLNVLLRLIYCIYKLVHLVWFNAHVH
jgi:hypothetical protein